MPPYSFTPGKEFSGEVQETGSNVSNVLLGDSAISFFGFGGIAKEIVIGAQLFLRPRSLGSPL